MATMATTATLEKEKEKEEQQLDAAGTLLAACWRGLSSEERGSCTHGDSLQVVGADLCVCPSRSRPSIRPGRTHRSAPTAMSLSPP
jgi:hypothetical protein